VAALLSPARITAPAGLFPSPSGLLRELARDLIAGFFRTFARWVASGTVFLLGEAWHSMSATTEPVLTGTAFTTEYHVMVLVGAGAVAPLLGLAVIQAVAHQDPSGLLRTAMLRLPMALLLTGVVIELVALGLTFTDQASVALLSTGGDPAARAFSHLDLALGPAPPDGYGFGQLVLVLVVALVAFMLWIELAVRSAAVAVATLFLPLALAGLVWPATAHWARRLGETLAGLVLMKLVMAAVLALAGGALAADAGGISSVVEGVALLGLTTFAPFALFRLIPLMEAGAALHLEGARATVKERAWSLASAGGHVLKGALTGSMSGSVSGSSRAPTADLPVAGTSPFAGGSDARSDGPSSRSGGGSGGVGGSGTSAGSYGGTSGRRGESGWLQRMADRRGKSIGGSA